MSTVCPHIGYVDNPDIRSNGMGNCVFCKMEEEDPVDPVTPPTAKLAADLVSSRQKAKKYVDAVENKQGAKAISAVTIAEGQLSQSAKKANKKGPCLQNQSGPFLKQKYEV